MNANVALKENPMPMNSETLLERAMKGEVVGNGQTQIALLVFKLRELEERLAVSLDVNTFVEYGGPSAQVLIDPEKPKDE